MIKRKLLVRCRWCGSTDTEVSARSNSRCVACDKTYLAYEQAKEIYSNPATYNGQSYQAYSEYVAYYQDQYKEGYEVPSEFTGSSPVRHIEKCRYCGATQCDGTNKLRDMCIPCYKIYCSYRNAINKRLYNKQMELTKYYIEMREKGFKVPKDMGPAYIGRLGGDQ